MSNDNFERLLASFESREHEALVSVWLTGALLKKAFRRVFRGVMKSEAQFHILRILKYAKEPVVQNDLSRMLLVDKSNITGLIDALEKSNLIERRMVHDDKRQRRIELTDKGRRLIDKVDEVYVAKVKELLSHLTCEEHQAIIESLKKLRGALDKVAQADSNRG